MRVLVQSLHHDVDQQPLLRVEGLELESSGCLLLTGANGSGKTTLLRVLAGLLRPQTASLEVDGRGGSWENVRDQLLSNTVYFHQTPYMFDRSVESNLGYGLRCRGIDRRKLGQMVAEALEWADLVPLARRNARRLSGGERQRLALARARVLRPKFLFLDEPTVGLDQPSKARTLELIAELAGDSVGVVVTSHEPDDILPLADRHFLLSEAIITERP